MKNMNLPNKLTMLRVILIPFFVVCELIPYSWGKWAALVIFVAASITDKLDGTIARKYNLITNFGKFMDPLADKLLVCSAMICFVGLGTLAPWIVIIIVAREFIISGFRLIAAENGRVIAAGNLGKGQDGCSDDYVHPFDYGCFCIICCYNNRNLCRFDSYDYLTG